MSYQVDRVDAPRIVIPLDDDLRARIIHEFHDTPSAGHLGREKSLSELLLATHVQMGAEVGTLL
ncbi:hypothetical protein PC114_g23480 [Phytophthora cactorum]|nr:hypothetical protein PC114_g23480 [Phytophthora cactorum]KAG3130295.1 hypothetical protein C6341_g23796 [Phytophthora cactorum]KAG3163101.1 hypothetical protein PC128_g20468 [Phytophthora cactorum]